MCSAGRLSVPLTSLAREQVRDPVRQVPLRSQLEQHRQGRVGDAAGAR